MSDPNDPSQPDLDTASSRVEAHKTLSLLANMLPRVLASDECSARRYSAARKRWQGIPFHGEESEHELQTFLQELVTQLTHALEGHSKILSTPMRALLYIERSAFYALEDYQQGDEQPAHMKPLWDVIRAMQQEAQIGNQRDPQEASWEDILLIWKTLKNAVHNVSSMLGGENKDNDAYS